MKTKQVQLSDLHIKVYKYIKQFIQDNYVSPTYREIATDNEISLSYSHRVVKELEVLEYLDCFGGRCRGIRVR